MRVPTPETLPWGQEAFAVGGRREDVWRRERREGYSLVGALETAGFRRRSVLVGVPLGDGILRELNMVSPAPSYPLTHSIS